MAYFNRSKELERTLKTIKQSSEKDFEVIIVNDGSDDSEQLDELAKNSGLHIKILTIKKEDKWYRNPCIPFNKGFKEASGDIILIQNPECFHVGDIISHAIHNVSNNKYITYACYSLSEQKTKELDGSNTLTIINRHVGHDGDEGWYNHSIFRRVYYHFTSAMTKKDLNDLGGFDERYAKGHGWDDNEFLERIKRKKMDISINDSPFSVHQWHYSGSSMNQNPITQCNGTLFRTVTMQETTWRVN